MYAAALFDRFTQHLKRRFADRDRAGAQDDPLALPTRAHGHAGIVDAARRAGLYPAGGVAPADRRAARRAARDAVDGRSPAELFGLTALALLALLEPPTRWAAPQRRAAEALLDVLTGMALPWDHDQAVTLLPAAQIGRDATARRLALELAISAARQAIARDGHSQRLVTAMVQAVRTPLPGTSSRRTRAELCALLPLGRERSALALMALMPAAGFARRGWTVRLHQTLTTGPPLTDADIRLLAHLPRTVPAKEPPATWRARCRELAAAGPVDALPGRLLAIAVDALRSGGWSNPGAGDMQLLAGAAWAAAALRDRPALALVERLVAELARVAWRRQEPLVAACAQVLVTAARERGAPWDAWAALAELRQASRRDVVQEQVDRAVETLLVRTGGTDATPTFGLDANGHLAVPVGDATAVLAVEHDAVRLRWRGRGGRLITRAPARALPLPAEKVHELRRLARVATVALTVHEPRRLEWLLRRRHVWDGRAWREEVLGHPLTGPVARRLLWQVCPAGRHPGSEADAAGWVTVLPTGNGTLVDAAGRWVDLPAAYQVRLWHPAGADGIDAEPWAALRFRQPIAQISRGTYHPTPAEVASGHRSARFAGHQVSRRTATARLAARGWVVDRGDRLARSLELLDGRVRAVVSLEPPEDPLLARTTATTGMVAFEQRPDAAGPWSPLPVPEVPPWMFSEVMRDLDRMVKAARDQTAVLCERVASLLPRLRIADRCRLVGRDLHVRGRRGSYRICLDNAAAYELRRGRHVCIVRGWTQDDALVPADPEFDDERLRLVLSKAFLLADDEHITDPVILSQLSTG